ncbi:MAG TPA: hypothetical protein DGT21_17360, partial [Armatimonadetes bacterium]|nr:hypothetical protein [Armatimonadota bacterium]
MAVGVVYDEVFTRSGPAWHFDTASRLLLTRDRLLATEAAGASLWDRLVRVPTHAAPPALIELIHESTYVDEIRMLSELGGEELDHETVVCPWTFDAACHAAGGAVAATAGIVRGELDAAFCLTRPPGHQALVDRPGGGCIFNTAAIAAAFALRDLDLRRVAVVDLDARHGIGTQSAFYTTRAVLYCSLHQYPLAPGTGALAEVGSGEGQGYTINLPLPVGARDEHALRCLEEVICPTLARLYEPELIIVSVGFAGHARDHSTDLLMSEQCYHAMTRSLMEVAGAICSGKLLLVLEGGYDREVAPLCAHNVCLALHGMPPTPVDRSALLPEGPEIPDLDGLVSRAIEFHTA